MVVKGSGPNLIGRNWLSIIRLNWHQLLLIKPATNIQVILDKHKTICNEMGLMKNVKATIRVSPEAKPLFFRPRHISYFIEIKST